MWRSKLLRRAEKPKVSKRDAWDKADIIAKFLSTVVIAIIGISITYQIQRTQILTNESIARAHMEALRAKATDDKKDQESQITIQLVNHLISEKAVQRRIAIVALRQSVPVKLYDPIVQILAVSDVDPEVRATAIAQLNAGQTPEITNTLLTIANDNRRPKGERSLAAQGAAQVSLRSNSSVPTYLFMASAPGEILADVNPFSSVVANAWAQDAKIGSASSLGEYVSSRVSIASAGKQNPVFSATGPMPSVEHKSLPGSAEAFVVGVSEYFDGNVPALRGPAADADRISAALRRRGFNVTLLKDPTKAELLTGLRSTLARSRGKPVIFYFSGHGGTSNRGAGWLVVDSTRDPSTWVLYSDLKTMIYSSGISASWIFIDAMDARWE